MIVGGEMSQSKVCPLSSRLNISIWEAQQLFWKSGGVFLQTIFAQTSQIVRSHYCSAFTQSCGFRPAIFQRSKVVGLIQCLARGGKTFMDMFWQTCGYFCFPGSELTKRMRRKKISETRPNFCRNGSGAHLPPEGLASGSSGAPNYKAGARAHPRLSHPPPVKRGAGGRLSYIYTSCFPLRSNFYNFLLCDNTILFRSWALCSWTLLKLLTMLRKVTEIDQKWKFCFICYLDKYN